MSETALTPPNDTTPTAPESLVIDGDAPRLGSSPITPPAPMGGAGVSVFDDAPAAPTLPVVSPVLSDPSVPMQTGAEYTAPAAPAPADPVAAAPSIPAPSIPDPVVPTAAPVAPAPAPAPAPAATPSQIVSDGAPTIPAPSLPTAAPTPPPATDDSPAPATDNAEHPMAHLMGKGDTGSAPNEASKRAAQLRAEKKAKAKKTKIYFAIGALAVSAVAGPPLWSWFTNALAEAGTSTEQPAD